MPETQSDVFISALSQKFGTVDYNRWQLIRWQWYGYTTYPTAGATQLNFFGNAVGQGTTTLADTNLPKSGSFGQQHFLLKTIATTLRVNDLDLSSFTAANVATADSRSLASDILHGFVQSGVLQFNIGSRPFATIPKPFMYCPPSTSRALFEPAHVPKFAAAAANASDIAVGIPDVRVHDYRSNVYRFDPNLLIEAEQQFEVKITFDSGAIPVIATGLTPPIDNTTNPLKVGVILDGYLLRPRQ